MLTIKVTKKMKRIMILKLIILLFAIFVALIFYIAQVPAYDTLTQN